MFISKAASSSSLAGFQSFKKRLREVLIVNWDINLDDCTDEAILLRLYHQGESPDFVAELLAS